MKRTAALATVLTVTLAVPGTAGADPVVTDVDIQRSVYTITQSSVYTIVLDRAVQSLETVGTDGSRVTMRISADLLFDFGKADLTAAARRRISQLAPQLKDAVGTIEVSGHSDSIGDPGHNQTLSTKRAEAVKAELKRVLGGDFGSRIQAKGFGETKPVAPNQVGGKDDPAGRAQNRRVEITFTKR